MFRSALYRCRARVLLAAAGALSFISSSQADLLAGYAVGSGGKTSCLVVDFAFQGGDAYLFTYHYDSSPTAEQMLLDLDAAGDLTVDYQHFTFTVEGVDLTSIFINGFSFAGNSAIPVFEGANGENWSYWISDNASSPYTSANLGPTDRVLTDGSVDGWALNVSAFNSQELPATAVPPASVPEPTSLALLTLAGLVLTRRSR